MHILCKSGAHFNDSLAVVGAVIAADYKTNRAGLDVAGFFNVCWLCHVVVSVSLPPFDASITDCQIKTDIKCKIVLTLIYRYAYMLA